MDRLCANRLRRESGDLHANVTRSGQLRSETVKQGGKHPVHRQYDFGTKFGATILFRPRANLIGRSMSQSRPPLTAAPPQPLEHGKVSDPGGHLEGRPGAPKPVDHGFKHFQIFGTDGRGTDTSLPPPLNRQLGAGQARHCTRLRETRGDRVCPRTRDAPNHPAHLRYPDQYVVQNVQPQRLHSIKNSWARGGTKRSWTCRAGQRQTRAPVFAACKRRDYAARNHATTGRNRR